MSRFDLDSALVAALELTASDIHIKFGAAPRVRVDGELDELPGFPQLTERDLEAVRARVVVSDLKRHQLEEHGSADLSYYSAAGRFRVAAFLQRGASSFVFRVIPDAPRAEDLGLPEVVPHWADAKRGLIVVSGPTGSGKSTTSAALVDLVNRRRSCHILTIEDPIEFVHVDRRSLVCQREIGTDAPTYHGALRAALRQDPDVILVGEVRDEETALTALRAAETGHLVICTLHTADTSETIKRFVDLFGGDRSALTRQMLAGTLLGVCSQRLIPGPVGGRVLNAEVLVNSARVRDLIGGASGQQDVAEAVAAGEFYGMRTFDQDLLNHVREGRISRDTALAYATSPHDFGLMLVSAGIDRISRRAEDMAPGHFVRAGAG